MKDILLVDGDPAPRGLAQRILQADYQVHPAASAAAALAVLAQQSVDLLIADLRLPDRSGTDLIAAARRRLPDLPCLALSASLEEAVGRWLQDRGIPVLAKPYRVQELLHEVERLLSGSVRLPAGRRALKPPSRGSASGRPGAARGYAPGRQ